MKKFLLLPILTSMLIVGCDSLFGDSTSDDTNSSGEFSFDEFGSPSTTNSDNSGKVINDDSESVNTRYSISFVDPDGNNLKTLQVEAGKMPVPGFTPTKESSAEYDYSFSRWEPALYVANKDQTYTAIFSATVRQYEITFYDSNGSGPIDTQYVNYGSRPTYKQLDKKGNDVFVGYATSPFAASATITKQSDFPTVTKNDTYYAVYQLDPETTYEVTFYLNEIGGGSSATVTKSTRVKVNTTPDFAALFPNAEVKCTSTTYLNQSDFQYYKFDNWYAGYLSKDQMLGKSAISASNQSKIGLKPITQDTTYYPIFKKVKLIDEYPEGYATYKENDNSSEFKILSWNDLKTNSYISISNKVLTPNKTKLSTLNSLYFVAGSATTSIVDEGFDGLSNLKYIYLNDDITSLGKRCFRNTGIVTASSFVPFVLPAKLRVIPEKIFEGVNINYYAYEGNSLTSIETNAFYGAGNGDEIVNVYFPQYENSNQLSGVLSSSWYGNRQVLVTFSDSDEMFPAN